MASIWKGSIAFGLVNIPVELRSAVKSAEKVSFRQLDKKHHKPIEYQRVSTVDRKVVAWKDIVKGFEISRGKFVVMEEEDLKALAPEMSRVLDITDFVPAASIDPRYFDSPYFLVPREGGDKAYALLRDALEETDKIGIGTFALRQKQHLAAIKPTGDALVLELMRFNNELVDPDDLKFPSSASVKVRPQEKQMAIQLIENLAAEFDPTKYHDVYTEQLKDIIKAKAKGKKIDIPEVAEREDTDVVDLVSRLQASLAAAKKPKAKKTARKRKSA